MERQTIKMIALLLLATMATTIPCRSQEWELHLEGPGETWVNQCLPVDGGDEVLWVGSSSLDGNGATDSDGLLAKVLPDGTLTRRDIHLGGMDLEYYCASQLANGGFMVFGVCDDSLNPQPFDRYLCVDVFNADLEPVSHCFHDMADSLHGGFYMASARHSTRHFRSIPEPGGTVLLACVVTYFSEASLIYHNNYRFLRFDSDGGLLECVTQAPNELGNSLHGITGFPGTDGYMLFGDGGPDPGGYIGFPGMYLLSHDLRVADKTQLATFGLFPDDEFCVMVSPGDRWDEDGLLWLSATLRPKVPNQNLYHVAIYKVDTAMAVHDRLALPIQKPGNYNSIPPERGYAYVNDSTAFVVNYERPPFPNSTLYCDMVVHLIDNQFNLLGTKVLDYDNVLIDPRQPVALSDGGCLLTAVEMNGSQHPGPAFSRCAAWKMRREDIEITWNAVPENGEGGLGRAFPNPTEGELLIQTPDSGPMDGRLIIIDTRGRTMVDRPLKAESGLVRLDVANLAPGTYTYRLEGRDGKTAAGKFVRR